MNKKGFTIVELLTAIVILGIIISIVYPAVISTIKASEEQAYQSQIRTIEKALKLYYLEHYDDLKELNENGTMDNCEEESTNALKEGIDPVTIDKLIAEGYISDNELQDGKIIDPRTKKNITGSVTVNWLCSKKQYEYKFK